MTCYQYGLLRGITKQAVGKAIRNKHNLPAVLSVKTIGRQYVLTVDENLIPKKRRAKKLTK